MRLDLDKRHVVENDLVPFHRALIEDLGRDVFRGNIDAFTARLVQHVGEQAHLKLETENVYPGDAFLAALQDDFLNEQPRDGQIHRPHRNQPPGLLAVESGKLLEFFGPVGF